MFEVFSSQPPVSELRDMFEALSVGNHVVSTLKLTDIQLYADSHGKKIKTRRLKDGRIKVRLEV